MQYLLLIYGDETVRPTAEQAQVMTDEYWTYTKQITEAGVYRGGDALHPSATGTVVRTRDGERLITDGPFAEAREQLGGYYEIEADNLDQALEWAARCPGSRYGAIEVRPIKVFDASQWPSLTAAP